MAKRLPLTANKELKRIEELPTGDVLDLSGSGIVDAESIQSEKFIGNLEGTADVSEALTNAANILDGTIEKERLTGEYDIDISGKANSLERAENILDGIIDPERLSGEYDINISGTSEKVSIKETGVNNNYYPTFVADSGSQDVLIDSNNGIVYNPNTNSLGINDPTPSEKLSVGGNVDVSGKVTALEYFGDGVNLTGIVTQIVPSIGININSTQTPGKGVVTIDAYKPVGKTIYVSQNGDDNNTGLAENHPKRTIKAAATVAVFGDTIKVFPGTYVEENPIILKKTVSVEGTELRNCVITAKYPYLDLFHVNNGCHITDISFIGPEMTDGASIVALQPLDGVEIDRYFDAARLIRLNLDYIANEAVGFLTSTQYIGAGRTQITDPVFTIVNSSGIATDSKNCSDDIKSILKCIIHDITRGGNSKSVEAGLSYYDDQFNLLHIVGTDVNGYSVKNATIDTIKYSADISRAIVNNVTWGSFPVGTSISVTSASYNNETGITTITTLSNHGLSKGDAVKIVGLGFTCPSGPGIVTYPTGTFGYIFDVLNIPDNNLNKFEVVVGQSTLPHTYISGGNIQKYGNIQSNFSQVKDLGIQKDPLTGFNNGINGCANVISALYSCVGIVTNIIGYGTSAFSVVGINTSYPGNAGKGFSVPIGVTSAIYDEESGKATITAPGLDVKRGELVELRDLRFSCTSGGAPSIQKFPSGFYGYQFYVNKINQNNSFEVFVGVSTLAHTYVGGGIVVNRSVGVTTASYNRTTGITTIKATGAAIKTGDLIKLRGLVFSCPDSPPNITYPTGSEGFDFKVLDIITDKPVSISTATYSNVTGIATVTAPGITLQKNDIVELRNLEFTCPDSPPNLLYPTGKNGYRFKVINVVGSTFTVDVGKSTIPHSYVTGGTAANKTNITSDTFTIKVGISTKEHSYVSGGVVFPPYSAGVGPITQGPYVRNCTNFVPNSIGMKIDGFAAEPGDTDDIGVTGTMSVDSYTQYNQGGIGVSITNGAYAQLVSIFTICNDIALFTGSGGQCDVTNSNSSFGRLGLVADGVGDRDSKSIYRYTGVVKENALIEQDRITISGIGNYRPYDGQAIYFDELFYTVESIIIDDPGSGYSEINPPNVIIDAPPVDAFGVRAEASPNVENGKVVSIDVIASGSQYRFPPKVTIAPPSGGGVQAKARAKIYPTYYTIESATLPSAGITTIVLSQNLNNSITAGSIAYFTRLSLQITSSHSFEWVGAGNDIFKAKPSLGGVVITDNEVVKLNGGEVVYTSTDQAGNFRIGDDIVINQITGTISGRAFSQSLLNTVTPLILGLSK